MKFFRPQVIFFVSGTMFSQVKMSSFVLSPQWSKLLETALSICQVWNCWSLLSVSLQTVANFFR